jgi:hypothetical protein
MPQSAAGLEADSEFQSSGSGSLSELIAESSFFEGVGQFRFLNFVMAPGRQHCVAKFIHFSKTDEDRVRRVVTLMRMRLSICMMIDVNTVSSCFFSSSGFLLPPGGGRGRALLVSSAHAQFDR